MKRFLIFLLVILLFLTGCGPKEGKVIDKRWKPDLSYWTTTTDCTGVGSQRRCYTRPYWNGIPAEYILTLEVPDGDIKDKHVSKKVYYKTNIGDYYREK